MGIQFRRPLKSPPNVRSLESNNGGYGSGPPGSGLSYSELLDLRKSQTAPPPVRIRKRRGGKRGVLAIGSLVLAGLGGVALWVMLSDAPDQRGSSTASLVGVVTASRLNCRTEPSPSSAVAHVAMRGEELVLGEERGPWRRVRAVGADCWVSSEYVHLAGPPAT